MHQIGKLGEKFVAQYLENKGWTILQQRWRCPWGEIDLIAQIQVNSPQIAFIEVKTRQQFNCDRDGLLAITPQKQRKIWQTANAFLSDYPHLADLPCRFDVALVIYTQINQEYKFTLKEYLESAWSDCFE
ncbi:MAG: YraN family protein [Gloeocapsa sp. DLM2.Bin57]|nr:MAG: YraN family protein [Gloeocapsa sp. DLM2.Bin57]